MLQRREDLAGRQVVLRRSMVKWACPDGFYGQSAGHFGPGAALDFWTRTMNLCLDVTPHGIFWSDQTDQPNEGRGAGLQATTSTKPATLNKESMPLLLDAMGAQGAKAIYTLQSDAISEAMTEATSKSGIDQGGMGLAAERLATGGGGPDRWTRASPSEVQELVRLGGLLDVPTAQQALLRKLKRMGGP